jgi:hypothetical protein
MSQTQRSRLADINARGIAWQHAAHQFGQVVLALLIEQLLERLVGIEVILDRTLGSTGDEHQPPGTGGAGLIHRILDQRLVDDRQHLFRAGLGGRQEPRAASCDREHRGPNLC